MFVLVFMQVWPLQQSPSLLHAIDHDSQGSHCEYSSSFPLLQSSFMRAQIESLSVHCDPGWEHFVHSWSAQVEDENEDEGKDEYEDLESRERRRVSSEDGEDSDEKSGEDSELPKRVRA